MEKKSAKILVLGPLPPPYGGGVASVVGSQLGSPALKGFDIRCLDTMAAERCQESVAGRTILSICFFSRLLVSLLFFRPDLVHLHGSAYFSFFEKSVMLLLCRLAGRKVIIQVHSGNFENFYRRTALKSYVRFALNRASAVVAVSAYWKSFLSKLSRAEVYEVPNCAGEKFFLDRASPDQGSDIVFVGQLSRPKGVLELLDAVHILRRDRGLGNRLVLAGGEGPSGELERVKARIESLGLSGVEIALREPPDKVRRMLARAAIFVLPSHAEGLPVSLLEAMAVGLPVVASRVGGITDAIIEGENGFLVPVGDSRMLAERIAGLLGDSALRSAMGQRNHKKALERYHPRITGSIIRELYETVLQ
ncbi:MAG: glycosyltransferase family 4 protein [Gemmatimonadota bacterium]|nr:glycosyltransferase family 4 protein [Gemmatimonadota bacterium]